jgi:opacity protein-like surface antigen
LDQNDFGAENLGLERYAAIQGSAKYEITRKLFGDINGRYRYSDVIGSADQGADDNTGEKVHRYRAGAGLTFEPLKWMAIRLGYNFNKVDSEDNEDDYDEHRGMLNITLTPDKPYRHID